jgi:hypothetical protein
MAVVTILCHGTANSTDRTTSEGSELVISKIQTLLDGADDWDWLLCEGAGTRKLRHQYTGTNEAGFTELDPDDPLDHIEPDLPHAGPRPAPPLAGIVGMPEARRIASTFPGGVFAGQGVDANVARAVRFVNHRKTQGMDGRLTVNLAGHSRGSMTCYKIASALDKMYGNHVHVNIFAIDPVPGNTGSINKKMYRNIALGSNVQNSFLMLAEMERRLNFRPYIDAKYAGGGDAHRFDTMPGIHGGINELTGTEWESARLVLSRALRFLKENGSRFRSAKGDGGVEYVEANQYILDKNGDHALGALAMYSRLMTRIKNYEGDAQSFNADKHRVANVAGPKGTWGEPGNQMTDPDTRGRADHHGLRMDEAQARMGVEPHALQPNRFFANQEHEELFQALYPAFYTAVSKLEKIGHPDSVKELREAIANAKTTHQRMSRDTKAYFDDFCLRTHVTGYHQVKDGVRYT